MGVVQNFERALLTRRVAARVAKEFSSPEALQEYLGDHPDADKSKHKVTKKKERKAPGSAKKHTPHSLRDKAQDLDRAGKHEDVFVQYSAAAELFRDRGDHAAAKSMDDAARAQAKKWKKQQKKK